MSDNPAHNQESWYSIGCEHPEREGEQMWTEVGQEKQRTGNGNKTDVERFNGKKTDVEIFGVWNRLCAATSPELGVGGGSSLGREGT